MNEESVRAACFNPTAVSERPNTDEIDRAASDGANVWQPVNHDPKAGCPQLMPYAVLRVDT